MAGIINKPKKSGERLLLRPTAGTQWEVWAMGDGNQTRLVQTCEAPADAPVSQQTVLALPLQQLFAVPLWLSTTDPALVRGMVFLQLERRGLAAGRSSQELIFDCRTVTSVENKTLVLAVALPGALPASLCLDIQAYEPSARVLPLPPDGIILWREAGRLVLAVTRGTELAYFHALGDEAASTAVLQELQCIKLQLEEEEVIAQVRGITLWGTFTPQEISAVSEAMNLRAVNTPLPAPRLPREWLDLVPASVRQAQASAKVKERKKSLVSVVAAVYALLLLLLILRLTWFYVDCRRLESGLKSHEAEVSEIEATSQQWDALDSAINPESYPVELLLRTASLLPPEGARFTFFGIRAGKIHIQGEAKNARVAEKFAADLKASKDLQDYQWEKQNPAILPNGNAKFQIEGVKYGAKTD